MSWLEIKDYMNSFIGILFLGVPLMITIWSQRKNEKNKNKKRRLLEIIIIIFIGCGLLAWLGFDKIKRDNNKDDTYIKDKKELSNKIDYLVERTKSDSEYQNTVKDKFKIGRDSMNQPFLIKTEDTYNTNIKNAENVHIGPKN